MMATRAYLNRFPAATRLTLVGPLYHGIEPFQPPVVFVDGGARYRRGGVGVAVGDGDSSPVPLDEMLRRDKDISDLGYALGQIPGHYKVIRLKGFLGGRRDHELFNLGAVDAFLNRPDPAAAVIFDDDLFFVAQGDWRFEIHGLFSLACLCAATVRLTGQCEYSIAAATELQPLSSFGLSNVGGGELMLRCNRPVFILRSAPATRIRWHGQLPGRPPASPGAD